MAPILLVFQIMAAGSVRGLEPGPCAGVRVLSVSRRSAVPGDVFVLTGSFGERLPIKVPSVNRGNGRALEVLDWTPSALSVRLPRGLAVGRHKVGLYCYYDGAIFSSGWHDLDVDEGAAPPFVAASPDLPPALPEDPRLLLGLGQSLWTQGLYEGCAVAYEKAASVFKVQGDVQREARARHGRSLALERLGRQDEADNEQNAAADLHWEALLAAPPGEVPRLESEYADIGYGAAQIAMRRGLLSRASEIHRIRLDIFTRHRNVSGQATAWQGLARSAAAGGRHGEAAGFFERAAELYRQADNPHGVKACEEAARLSRLGGGLGLSPAGAAAQRGRRGGLEDRVSGDREAADE